MRPEQPGFAAAFAPIGPGSAAAISAHARDASRTPPPPPMTAMPTLDLRRSLYDSYGCRHALVHATPRQVLTRLEGAYWLWDRASGRCLLHGLAGECLSNARPADTDLRAQGDAVAETRAYQLARQAMRRAAGRPLGTPPATLAAAPSAVRERPARGVLPRPGLPAGPVARRSEPPAAERSSALPLSGLALFAAAAFACLLPPPARR